MSRVESNSPDDSDRVEFSMNVPTHANFAKLVELMTFLREISNPNDPFRVADAREAKRDKQSGEIVPIPLSKYVARARVNDAIKTLFEDPEGVRLKQELEERFPEETWRGVFPMKSALNTLSAALAEQQKE